MKKLLFSLFAIMVFVACTKGGAGIEGTPEITVQTDIKEITTPYNHSTVIRFTATDNWTAYVVSTRADDWCSVSPESGKAGEAAITITTTTNDTSEMRSAEVVIQSGDIKKSIKIKQNIAPKPNQIFYTTSHNMSIMPVRLDFGAKIVSNFYEKGQGVITFDDNVTKIGESAFASSDCNTLTSITIPDSVTSIGDSAFGGCWRLTSVTIPDSVTSIGRYAFSGCESLSSITIPDCITTIGPGAFFGCLKLKSFYGKFASDDNRYIIFDGVLNCFASYGLATYEIPDSITSIGDHAFGSCSLTSITIPNSVTSIGNYAFSACLGLTSITIPDNVTSIGNGVFEMCYNLTSVTFPNSITSIGDYTFYHCERLESVTIPDSVTSIGTGAFNGCNKLTSITIPNSVTSIGPGVFNGCSKLTSITIPDSVTSIGNYTFYYCSNLTSVYCKPKTPPTIYSSTFNDCKIYVPSESVDAYKVADEWKNYADNIVGYDF